MTDPYAIRREAEAIIGEDRVPTDVLVALIAAHGPDALPPSRAELANDGHVRCSECGTDQFEYHENVPSVRSMDANEDGVLVFYGSGRDYDGDDDPGVVCENGHECDTGDDVGIEWS